VLDLNGYIKLTDLGLAKEIAQEDATHTFCGTPEYLAPEIIRGEAYGKSVDLWCLGIILYEMLFGFPPFFDKNKEKLYKKIIFNEPDYTPSNSNILNEDAKDLISKFLQKNPKDRLKISKVKEHPFFKEINIPDLLQFKIQPPFKPDISSEFNFIDPKLKLEKPEDSMYNGLSPMHAKEDFPEFTYAEKIINK